MRHIHHLLTELLLLSYALALYSQLILTFNGLLITVADQIKICAIDPVACTAVCLMLSPCVLVILLMLCQVMQNTWRPYTAGWDQRRPAGLGDSTDRQPWQEQTGKLLMRCQT